MRLRILILLLLVFLLPSCVETKSQAYNSRRGLMMMDKSEYESNKKVYKSSNTLKKVKKKIKKKHK
jgi:hypothetical protein